MSQGNTSTMHLEHLPRLLVLSANIGWLANANVSHASLAWDANRVSSDMRWFCFYFVNRNIRLPVIQANNKIAAAGQDYEVKTEWRNLDH
jgi:hypothetical protein